jgi:hypothetical protein
VIDDSVSDWLNSLDGATYEAVMAAVLVLSQEGPSLGRPLADTVKGSSRHNMKELRPPVPGRQAIRVLFIFDPARTAVLLVGGDKARDWVKWYRRNIPLAEARYERHLQALETRKREGGK